MLFFFMSLNFINSFENWFLLNLNFWCWAWLKSVFFHSFLLNLLSQFFFLIFALLQKSNKSLFNRKFRFWSFWIHFWSKSTFLKFMVLNFFLLLLDFYMVVFLWFDKSFPTFKFFMRSDWLLCLRLKLMLLLEFLFLFEK